MVTVFEDSGADNPDFSYGQILSREGLTTSSTNLVNYVCTAFTILELVDDFITKFGLTVRKETERVLIHCFQSFETFSCTTHEAMLCFVIFSKTKFLTRSLIYVHKFGFSKGKNG